MEIAAIDDDPLLLHTIQMVLEEDFGDILKLEHPISIEDQLSKHPIQVIILDLNFAIGTSDSKEGLAWVSKIKDRWDHISIIVLTAHGFIDVAVNSLKLGAMDFIEKPFVNEKLVATVKAALTLAQSKQQLALVTAQKKLLINQLNQEAPNMIITSEVMKNIHKTVIKVANSDASVLITGEHGTGKEMIARLIHQESKRVTEPFVHIDLGSLVESLFESTLFGHAKGAFTDAGEDKAGLVEMADLGTLFLDNISELSLNQQAKLLSVIQNREVMRVGEHLPRAVDIRLICTTHLTLDQLSSTRDFRQDLFFRINTMVIELPPLRHRLDDIKPLINHFLDHFNSKYNKVVSLSKTEISTLRNHSWPGNVRELMNTLERVVIMEEEESNTLQIKAFEESEKSDNLYAIESAKIAEIIARHSGNISRAAQELGIGRNTLYRKIKKYDL